MGVRHVRIPEVRTDPGLDVLARSRINPADDQNTQKAADP